MKKISISTITLLGLTVLLMGCGPRDNVLKKLADEGIVNQKAIRVTSASIEIEATNQYVWEILTNTPNWPNWNPATPEIRTTEAMYKGNNFAWKWGKKVYTAVHYFEAPQKLAWFSKSMAYRSIMVWEFEPLTDHSTRVTVTESRDGFSMYFVSAKKHKALLEAWLGHLKNRSEVVQFH